MNIDRLNQEFHYSNSTGWFVVRSNKYSIDSLRSFVEKDASYRVLAPDIDDNRGEYWMELVKNGVNMWFEDLKGEFPKDLEMLLLCEAVPCKE